MAKSQHSFQKRKRELEKKKKREEKLQRKIEKKFDEPATFEEMVVSADNVQPVKENHAEIGDLATEEEEKGSEKNDKKEN